MYTSSTGERRIRVHTLCLPVSSLLEEVLTSIDQEAVIGLVSKMAVDRSLTSSVTDARDAMINVVSDLCNAYSLVATPSRGGTCFPPLLTFSHTHIDCVSLTLIV